MLTLTSVLCLYMLFLQIHGVMDGWNGLTDHKENDILTDRLAVPAHTHTHTHTHTAQERERERERGSDRVIERERERVRDTHRHTHTHTHTQIILYVNEKPHRHVTDIYAVLDCNQYIDITKQIVSSCVSHDD